MVGGAGAGLPAAPLGGGLLRRVGPRSQVVLRGNHEETGLHNFAYGEAPLFLDLQSPQGHPHLRLSHEEPPLLEGDSSKKKLRKTHQVLESRVNGGSWKMRSVLPKRQAQGRGATAKRSRPTEYYLCGVAASAVP